MTQYTAGLQYTDQPGAMNEATSDIFGACIAQSADGAGAQAKHVEPDRECTGPIARVRALTASKAAVANLGMVVIWMR